MEVLFEKIAGNLWLAYSIALYCTGHWIGGIVATAVTVVVLFT